MEELGEEYFLQLGIQLGGHINEYFRAVIKDIHRVGIEVTFSKRVDFDRNRLLSSEKDFIAWIVNVEFKSQEDLNLYKMVGNFKGAPGVEFVVKE